MTPAELYARTPEKVDEEINRLFGFNHIPEIEDHEHCGWIPDSKNDRVEFHIYKDFDFDGRRTWFLAAVKFDGVFVMVIQNAGREGDDHSDRCITNKPAYDAMVTYIRTLCASEDASAEDVVDEHEDIPQLASFYGNDLDGVFERYYL